MSSDAMVIMGGHGTSPGVGERGPERAPRIPASGDHQHEVMAVLAAEWRLGELARALRRDERSVTPADRAEAADMLTALAARLRANAVTVIDTEVPR